MHSTIAAIFAFESLTELVRVRACVWGRGWGGRVEVLIIAYSRTVDYLGLHGVAGLYAAAPPPERQA